VSADGPYVGDIRDDPETGYRYVWDGKVWVFADLRRQVLDLLDRIWERASGIIPEAETLTKLADPGNPDGPMVDYRRWLEEVLTR
jgi:hypothetical protein